MAFLCRWVLICLCKKNNILWCSKPVIPRLLLNCFFCLESSFSLISNQECSLPLGTQIIPWVPMTPLDSPCLCPSRWWWFPEEMHGPPHPAAPADFTDTEGAALDPNMREMRLLSRVIRAKERSRGVVGREHRGLWRHPGGWWRSSACLTMTTGEKTAGGGVIAERSEA